MQMRAVGEVNLARHSLGWLFAGCCALAAPVTAAPLDAHERRELQQWLDRMTHAARNLDYEGTFAYQHGNSLDTLHLRHVVDQDGERERLLALDGTPREVHRDPHAVTCIFPDANAVLVGTRGGNALFGGMVNDVERLAQSYEPRLGRSDRVAGLASRVLELRPRDRLRYGYRVWLTEQHGLPVKGQVVDENQRVIEQFSFTQLQVSDPGIAARPEPEAPATPPEAAAGAPRWIVRDLPAGFELIRHGEQRLPGDDTTADVLLFSDGATAISVYVEPAAGAQAASAVMRRGAVHIVQLVRDGLRTTVLGEVPVQTVQRVAASLERVPEAAR